MHCLLQRFGIKYCPSSEMLASVQEDVSHLNLVNLKIEAVFSSETSEQTRHATRWINPKDDRRLTDTCREKLEAIRTTIITILFTARQLCGYTNCISNLFYALLLPEKCRHYVPPKRLYLSIRLHDVTSKKTVICIFIVERISNL